ncbi:MAG: M20/M25/M40 family metallo-hydrolase [Sphingomonadaceae bacterium]|nr:M20/M25/M40 family metallo-hydrolase [Sphingomonadaceae bacterium]
MNRHFLLAAGAIAALATPLAAQTPDPAAPERMRALVERLVSFGTRHTLSSADHPTRGIGAARRWGASEFESYSAACGGCLEVTTISDRFTGDRAPDGVVVENVLAIQRGRNPDRVVILQGHIDSRVSDPMNFTEDAPGANDDGSGTALVIEAARILSQEDHDATIVYALLSGEEQGLWGGTLLARHATEQGWDVAAVLNNDIVGNTLGSSGEIVDDRVRVFSEGIRSSEDIEEQMVRRGNGGEIDGPSRALARLAARVAEANPGLGLEVFKVGRPDRFRRGGDHIPMLAQGFPAVRFTVGAENYNHQHQDLRTEDGVFYGDTVDYMDFPYLGRVTALNVAVAREIANAPAAPGTVTIAGAVSPDSTITWTPVDGAARYRVHWRRNDRVDWEHSHDVMAGETELTLENVVVDDHFFGVSAIAAGGEESMVTFGGGPARR